MSGPCAKRRVVCSIQYGGSPEEFVLGTNDCANPQEVCPRLPGESYIKCQTICQQGAHAEVKALMAAKGLDLRGSVATITGHYYICEPCGRALREAGIGRVNIVLAA